MRNRIAALMVAMLVAMSGLVASATPAQANQTCPSDYVCFYNTTLSSTGTYYTPVQGYYQSGCHNASFTSLGWNNIKSIKNNTGRKYFVYHTTNCTGEYAIINPHTNGNMDSNWIGDRINSMIRTVI